MKDYQKMFLDHAQGEEAVDKLINAGLTHGRWLGKLQPGQYRSSRVFSGDEFQSMVVQYRFVRRLV